jgi:hypothetical protein
MNVKRSVVAVAACVCGVVLLIATYGVGASTPNRKLNPQLTADGGAPMPPWPPKVQLMADGGAPMPPWPPNPSKAQTGG